MPWMYILRCSDASYYVGSCRDLDHRMAQHASGRGAEYTAKRMPVDLVFAQQFEHIGEAYAREKQVQGWSRRKREALIAGEWEQVRHAARKRSR